MATGKRLWFHSLALIHHLVTMAALARVDWKAANNEKLMQIYEFSDRFFTTWNFTFQVIYLTCAVLHDVGEINPELVERFWPHHQLMKKCATARDFIFSTIVFPCSIMVAVLFWIVFNYDRELVMPQECDLLLPPFVNHAIHTDILIVVALELLLGDKKKPHLKRTASLLWLGAVIVIYYAVFLGTYYSTGRWIYAIFNLWNWTERAIFLIFNAVGLYILFFVGAHAQELAEQYHKIKESKKAIFQNGGLSTGENNADINSQGNNKKNNSTAFQNGGVSKFEEACVINSKESNGLAEKSNRGKYSGLKRIYERTDLFESLD